MSKLDDLIERLCPDGVVWAPLWTETVWDKKFNSVKNNKQPRIVKHTYLLSSELKSLAIEGANEVKLLNTGLQDFGWTSNLLAGELSVHGEIVSIPWGGTPSVQYFSGTYVTSDNRIAQVRDPGVLSTKFLYFFLQSQIKFIESCYRGSGIKHPDMSKILDFKIPIPPLSIQNEIVGILDAFSQLDAELEAELLARETQYRFYLNSIVNFSDTDTKWLPLGECLRENRGGGTPSTASEHYWGGNIPWVSVGDLSEPSPQLITTRRKITELAIKESSTNLIPAGWLIVAVKISPGKSKIAGVDLAINQDMRGLFFHEWMLPKFVHYFLENSHFSSNGSIVQGITNKYLEGVLLPVPTLEVQAKIVHQLDTFSELLSGVGFGLPKELEERRKQYEYYRDKLLTFKELAA